jgi:hypothetical protein
MWINSWVTKTGNSTQSCPWATEGVAVSISRWPCLLPLYFSGGTWPVTHLSSHKKLPYQLSQRYETSPKCSPIQVSE